VVRGKGEEIQLVRVVSGSEYMIAYAHECITTGCCSCTMVFYAVLLLLGISLAGNILFVPFFLNSHCASFYKSIASENSNILKIKNKFEI